MPLLWRLEVGNNLCESKICRTFHLLYYARRREPGIPPDIARTEDFVSVGYWLGEDGGIFDVSACNSRICPAGRLAPGIGSEM